MRVLLFDETAGALSWVWRNTAWVGGFDAVVPARSWHGALLELERLTHQSDKRVLHLQFWGHGQSGRPLIGGTRLHSLGDLRAAARLAYGSEVWWRACDVFSRASGADFALQAVYETQGAAHVGHTRVVSWPWPMLQSGGYGLRSGEDVWWDPYEGVADDGRSLGSHPLAPHTTLVTQMQVPRAWWRSR